jgi:hypothetical protein
MSKRPSLNSTKIIDQESSKSTNPIWQGATKTLLFISKALILQYASIFSKINATHSMHSK